MKKIFSISFLFFIFTLSQVFASPGIFFRNGSINSDLSQYISGTEFYTLAQYYDANYSNYGTTYNSGYTYGNSQNISTNTQQNYYSGYNNYQYNSSSTYSNYSYPTRPVQTPTVQNTQYLNTVTNLQVVSNNACTDEELERLKIKYGYYQQAESYRESIAGQGRGAWKSAVEGMQANYLKTFPNTMIGKELLSKIYSDCDNPKKSKSAYQQAPLNYAFQPIQNSTCLSFPLIACKWCLYL